MTKALRFGLIGCGDFGCHLGQYLLEVGQITAVCDKDVTRARQSAKQLEIDVPAYGDFHDLLERDDVDAVVITAANFVHAEIAIAAAEAGLHVFCEKAMARTVKECQAMVNACDAAGVKLMVGHKRRLRPSWARMLELMDDSLLGAPLCATVTQYADMRPYRYADSWWADPKLSGGPFAVMGVHVIDWFAALFGRAARVSAVYGSQVDPGYLFPDIIHATFQFAGGGLATINTSFNFPLQQFREAQGPMVQCRHGGLRLSPQMQHIDLHYQRLDESQAHHERFVVDDDFAPAYRREIADFVRWVRGEIDNPCLTWEQGLHCVEMMEAAYLSAQQQGAWIDVSARTETADV